MARTASQEPAGRLPGYVPYPYDGAESELYGVPEPEVALDQHHDINDAGPAHEELLFAVYPQGEGPPMDLDPKAEDRLWHAQNEAYGHATHDNPAYWLDDQLHGEGVPPGAPNDQPFLSGHTSIVIHNPAEEQGWGQDPAFRWPRYPHMENGNPYYGLGVHRRNGQKPEEDKDYPWAFAFSLQERDLALRLAILHRAAPGHNVLTSPPTVTHTENMTPAEPIAPYALESIGAEGVTP